MGGLRLPIFVTTRKPLLCYILSYFSISQYSMCWVLRLLLKLNWMSFRTVPEVGCLNFSTLQEELIMIIGRVGKQPSVKFQM